MNTVSSSENALLISASELNQLLQQKDLDILVCDCRFDLTNTAAGFQAWQAGHIPKAIYVHLDNDLSTAKTGKNGRHPLPTREQFAQTVASFGIRPTTRVIAYDAQGGMFAARLWWMLRWLGHTRVSLLDGGLPAWQKINGEVLADGTSPTPAPTYPLSTQAGMPTLTAQEVNAALGTERLTLIDARAADRFRGENETLDPKGGHIPGAKNHFFKNNLNEDGTFLSSNKLQDAFLKVLAGSANANVVHQCGSGVTACHNLFAMQVAGLESGALYPGSWSEWCAQADYPVATGN